MLEVWYISNSPQSITADASPSDLVGKFTCKTQKSKKRRGKIHLNIKNKHSKVTFRTQKPSSFTDVYKYYKYFYKNSGRLFFSSSQTTLTSHCHTHSFVRCLETVYTEVTSPNKTFLNKKPVADDLTHWPRNSYKGWVVLHRLKYDNWM